MTTPQPTRCGREGCTGRRRKDPATGKLRPCCTGLCNFVRRELEALEMMITTAGPGPTTASAWAALVELSDQLTRYNTLKDSVYRILNAKEKIQ